MVKKIPTKLEKHGHVRVDDYHWLREREDSEVIHYLNEENERAAKEMARTGDFEEKLFEEIKGRFKQTDMSVPYRRDDYFYYTRYEQGKEYPIYARKRSALDQPEEIMLDANVLAEGHEFFSIGGSAVSHRYAGAAHSHGLPEKLNHRRDAAGRVAQRNGESRLGERQQDFILR